MVGTRNEPPVLMAAPALRQAPTVARALPFSAAKSSTSSNPPNQPEKARPLTPTLRHGENSAVPVERITKEQLKERLDRGETPTILDVRLKYAYEHSTVKLPGAIRVPPYAIDSVSIPSTAATSSPTIPIPTSWSAPTSRPSFCERASRVRVLKGGVPEWLAANFPIETKEAPRSIPPEPGSLKG